MTSMPYPFFFFNDTATTEIYTLSLHDALPIFPRAASSCCTTQVAIARRRCARWPGWSLPCAHRDRKSTRLNSSHSQISYAVFCLKKKKKESTHLRVPRVLSPELLSKEP